MSILTPTYFESGIYTISQDRFTEADLQKFIDTWEPYYLVRMFGVDLYELFKADLNAGVPQTARFTKVFNPFAVQSESSFFYNTYPLDYGYLPQIVGQNCIHESFGIKDMLAGFIFFEFMRDLAMKATPVGHRKPSQEVSDSPGVGRSMIRIEDTYNRAIGSFQAIQWFMKYGDESGNYPEYKGINICKIFLGGAI